MIKDGVMDSINKDYCSEEFSKNIQSDIEQENIVTCYIKIEKQNLVELTSTMRYLSFVNRSYNKTLMSGIIVFCASFCGLLLFCFLFNYLSVLHYGVIPISICFILFLTIMCCKLSRNKRYVRIIKNKIKRIQENIISLEKQEKEENRCINQIALLRKKRYDMSNGIIKVDND